MMTWLLALLVCFLLAACTRTTPAPVTSCYSYQHPVEIDGAVARGLSTYCIDENGGTALRPEGPPQR